MSCVKIDPALHQAQKPPWIKVRLPSNPVFFSTRALISDLRLHTVCESAQCPNRWECWSQGTATMMIAGDRCTRACGFCAVTTAKPFALEADEPRRGAAAPRGAGATKLGVAWRCPEAVFVRRTEPAPQSSARVLAVYAQG